MKYEFQVFHNPTFVTLPRRVFVDLSQKGGVGGQNNVQTRLRLAKKEGTIFAGLQLCPPKPIFCALGFEGAMYLYLKSLAPKEKSKSVSKVKWYFQSLQCLKITLGPSGCQYRKGPLCKYSN